MVHFGQSLRLWATGASSITSETGLSLRAAGATPAAAASSRLIHRIMLFPFTLPAPRWRFHIRRRDDVQLTGRQPAHPPARGQLLIRVPSPLCGRRAISFAPESGMAMGENDCVCRCAPRDFPRRRCAARHDPPPLRFATPHHGLPPPAAGDRARAPRRLPTAPLRSGSAAPSER